MFATIDLSAELMFWFYDGHALRCVLLYAKIFFTNVREKCKCNPTRVAQIRADKNRMTTVNANCVGAKRKNEWEDGCYEDETKVEGGDGGGWEDCVFGEQRKLPSGEENGVDDEKVGGVGRGTWRLPPKLRIIPPSVAPETVLLPPQTLIQERWHRETWSWLLQSSRVSLHHRSPTPLHRCMLENPLQYIEWDRERCVWIHPTQHFVSALVARPGGDFDMTDGICAILKKRGAAHTVTITRDKTAPGGGGAGSGTSGTSGSSTSSSDGISGSGTSGSGTSGSTTETWIYDIEKSTRCMYLRAAETATAETNGEKKTMVAEDVKAKKYSRVIWIRRTSRPGFVADDGSVVWDVADFLFQLSAARETVADYFTAWHINAYPGVLVKTINDYL